MDTNQWIKEFPGAITICDLKGVMLEMNERAIRAFEADGGIKLIGTNLLDCHPEPSRSKLKDLLLSGEKNIYTIEKNGVRKLIYQSPWYKNGKHAGLVELSLEIPVEMRHFVRV